MPYNLQTNVEIREIYRNAINADEMPYNMVKCFNRSYDGYDTKNSHSKSRWILIHLS